MKLENLKGNTDILKTMKDYLYNDFETGEKSEFANDVGYTQSDIDECGKILDRYIDNLINIGKAKSHRQILLYVKSVIEELNVLNERCNYSIIETDQREELVPYILKAAIAGLVIGEEDITEEWREW